MSLFTRPMKLLTSVVLESQADEIAQKLLTCGVIDFIEMKSFDLEKLKLHSLGVEKRNEKKLNDLELLSKQMVAIYSQSGRPLPEHKNFDINTVDPLDFSACQTLLNTIQNKILSSRSSQREANNKLIVYKEMHTYCETGSKYLEIRVGKFDNDITDDYLKQQLANLRYIYIPKFTGDNVILTYLRRDGGKINPTLDSMGWIETDNTELQKKAIEKTQKEIELRMDEQQKLVDDFSKSVSDIVNKNGEKLDSYYRSLLVNRLCSKIKTYFTHTKNTSIFSGWVPVESTSLVEKAIIDVCGDQCIVEWTDASDAEDIPVPVEIVSPKALKPFQRIVENYSTPEYGTVNPTPFVMVAYITMFALMFADVGQGFILLLIGLFMGRSYKKNPLKKPGLITPNLCDLLIYLGIASMVGGAMFGSYFGYSLLPPLWFNYHGVVMGTVGESSLIQDVYGLLGITIWYGLIVICVGLGINWINLYRKKRWVQLIFDRYGISGSMIYIVGFFTARYFVLSGYKNLPPGNLWKWLIGIPVILLAFKEPFKCLIKKEKFKIDLMEWVIDLLEIFSGYLSNTLSFMRVAGLGIAHVSLMVAFEDMSLMVPGIVGKLLIMIIGNLLVIALEGLSAGIQALRLNYYEFFTKFFTGKGVAYKPVNIEM